ADLGVGAAPRFLLVDGFSGFASSAGLGKASAFEAPSVILAARSSTAAASNSLALAAASGPYFSPNAVQAISCSSALTPFNPSIASINSASTSFGSVISKLQPNQNKKAPISGAFTHLLHRPSPNGLIDMGPAFVFSGVLPFADASVLRIGPS